MDNDVNEIVDAIRSMTKLNAKSLMSNIYGSGNSAELICQILSKYLSERKIFHQDEMDK